MSNVVAWHDVPTNLTLSNIQTLLRPGQPTLAEWHDYELSSHFQPIYSLAHRRAVGYEALVRVRKDQQPLSPLQLFGEPKSDPELIALDRACRALHIANFQQMQQQPLWLFLNSQPKAFVHGRRYGAFFADLLEYYQIPPQQIVLEILETELEDPRLLQEAVHFFRELGCLIAIDDFGAGHSNIDRIWQLSPNIVKLDRSLVAEAARTSKIRSVLSGMVSLLHETGALVLLEGVETQTEALIAMDCDADFVQGYYFARPTPRLQNPEDIEPCFQQLWTDFQQQAHQQRDLHQNRIQDYILSLKQAAKALELDYSLYDSCRSFLAQPLAQTCFLLDADGYQQEQVRIRTAATRIQFQPLLPSQGACWARRAYFRRALANPGEVQITRPYLSLNDAQTCITLSVAIQLNQKRLVLCGDIRWQDH